MKIGKQYLGKVVEIQWMDPNFQHVEDIKTMEKGRDALATWKEWGVVHDITDGVVLLVHSAAASAGKGVPPENTSEVGRTAIPDVLIEKITVFAPIAVPEDVPAEGKKP